MPTRVVIFDVDGTLVDSVDLHAEAWREAFLHFGKDFAFDEIRSQIGKGGDELLPHFLTEKERDEFAKPLEEYRKKLFEDKFASRMRPFPRVRELLERVREAGFKIALGTSSPEEELQPKKKLCNIEDLVDEESTADDAEKSKPHPDIFEAALGKFQDAPAKAAVAIGDTPYDAEAARKAGVRSIGFLCGGFPEKDLRAAGCEEIYQGPEDLLQRFASSALLQAGGR